MSYQKHVGWFLVFPVDGVWFNLQNLLFLSNIFCGLHQMHVELLLILNYGYVQKVNHCINIPASWTFRCYLYSSSVNILWVFCKVISIVHLSKTSISLCSLLPFNVSLKFYWKKKKLLKIKIQNSNLFILSNLKECNNSETGNHVSRPTTIKFKLSVSHNIHLGCNDCDYKTSSLIINDFITRFNSKQALDSKICNYLSENKHIPWVHIYKILYIKFL